MMESMLSDFVEKIVGLARTEVKEINGRSYATKEMEYIEPVVDEPAAVAVSSLDSVVRLIELEHEELPSPLFVHVDNFNSVRVFSGFAPAGLSEVAFKRFNLCRATFDDISVSRDETYEHEAAMIALRSRYIRTEDVDYLLDLLSSITQESSAKTEDNGLSQSVSVKKGIALKERVAVKSIVTLRPFRTFFEVDQPSGEFLIRVLDGNRIRILEADGGAWKAQAKKNIKSYLEDRLSELIADHKVVVMI